MQAFLQPQSLFSKFFSGTIFPVLVQYIFPEFRLIFRTILIQSVTALIVTAGLASFLKKYSQIINLIIQLYTLHLVKCNV